VSVDVDFEMIKQRDPETGKAFLFAMKLEGREAFLIRVNGKLALQCRDESQPRNCRCQPLGEFVMAVSIGIHPRNPSDLQGR
jgi:hypothetical protein